MLTEILKEVSESAKKNGNSLYAVSTYQPFLAKAGWKHLSSGTNKTVWEHPDYDFLLKTGYTVLSEARKYGELPIEIQEKCAKVYLAGEIDGLEFSLVERIKGREMKDYELSAHFDKIADLLECHGCRYSFEWQYYRNVMLTDNNDFRFIDLS